MLLAIGAAGNHPTCGASLISCDLLAAYAHILQRILTLVEGRKPPDAS